MKTMLVYPGNVFFIFYQVNELDTSSLTLRAAYSPTLKRKMFKKIMPKYMKLFDLDKSYCEVVVYRSSVTVGYSK